MLALPDKYTPQSSANYDINILCDWIEGSILFDKSEEGFRVMDIVDVLTDNGIDDIDDDDIDGIYKKQALTIEIVVNALEELKRRLSWIAPGIPFSITDSQSVVDSQVKRISSWQDTPAHSFCVLLSLAQCYTGWPSCISNWNYNAQGKLFELLTQESLKKQFSDWNIKRTGWSSTQSVNLHEVINRIANCLGETASSNLDEWIGPQDKDAGLDILCYRSFPDNRVGFPVYLMQCASGQHWERKVSQPIINRWRQFIEFVVLPQKAFAVPFALSDDIFKKRCAEIGGLFLDRYRLLAAARYSKQWESSSLKDQIIEWTTPKVDQLPRN